MPSIDTFAFHTKVVLSQDTGQIKVEIKFMNLDAIIQMQFAIEITDGVFQMQTAN